MQILDNNGKVQSDAVVLKSYFGFQPGQTLAGFMAEVKQLTLEDKAELVVGAAKELNWTIQ